MSLDRRRFAWVSGPVSRSGSPRRRVACTERAALGRTDDAGSRARPGARPGQVRVRASAAAVAAATNPRATTRESARRRHGTIKRRRRRRWIRFRLRRARSRSAAADAAVNRSTPTIKVFSFVRCRPGRYTLNASKSGCDRAACGAKRRDVPARRSSSLTVRTREAQHLDPKRQRDARDRRPTRTATVRRHAGARDAFRDANRREDARTGGLATTDDRAYRIWGLQPGDYIVSAGAA